MKRKVVVNKPAKFFKGKELVGVFVIPAITETVDLPRRKNTAFGSRLIVERYTLDHTEENGIAVYTCK